jgi:hypothetical protein
MMRFWQYEKDKDPNKNHFLVILGDQRPFIFAKPAKNPETLFPKDLIVNDKFKESEGMPFEFGHDANNREIGRMFLELDEYKICNA